ncbi:PREDICTED: uncharacterized protein LOC109227404 isoform X2 [Nicotiana attenuata]|uniref:Thioesterase domain-containing protein n=1 Tax=Nicotiana attenuata TaxID=49451 RepID=A0A1J6ICX0_NICAT|nr:PREDICTED: uncharacterized protein LOC109227404 isoform X2 [Nicotiana attenuata]OIT02774.1 hypothetical protein A4A49_21814 [Nicotiana attenuata]
MDKAKAYLEPIQGESDRVSSLAFHPHRDGTDYSFYEYYALRGIRVDRVEPGQVFCTFKVPSRLTDREGKLASGAIANLVDEVGGAVVLVEGLPRNVSVDMSISFLSSAKADVSPPYSSYPSRISLLVHEFCQERNEMPKRKTDWCAFIMRKSCEYSAE